MNLLRVVADDLRHLGQVYDGYAHLIDAEVAYVETDEPDLLPLRADRIADEAALVLWHLERSRAARWVVSGVTPDTLRADVTHWRQCAQDLRKQADQGGRP
jgi:hypothetical protein